MGRGIAYQWPFFMLYEENVFWEPNLSELSEEERDNLSDDRYDELKSESLSTGDGEWDEMSFEDFRGEVADLFKADIPTKKRWIANETYIFAENDKLEIGIDHSGGGPCLFVKPKTYQLRNGDEQEYSIAKVVNRAFNKLIKRYRGMEWSVPTSAWTSVEIEQYGPMRNREVSV